VDLKVGDCRGARPLRNRNRVPYVVSMSVRDKDVISLNLIRADVGQLIPIQEGIDQ
jgi:hypothetical protein